MDFIVEKHCEGLPDSHLHTKFSFDSDLEPEYHASEAQRLGLCAITITDHCDLGTDTWNDADITASVAAANAMKGRYPFDVYAGIELGEPTFIPADTEHVLALADFDFVLGSMHIQHSGADYYYLEFTEGKTDPYAAYDEYLYDMYEMTKQGLFDSLAHITYPLRYIIGRDRIDFDESRYYARYDDILRELVRQDKAMEINTSGVRRENGFMLPDLRLVARFRDFGGKYITLGSDSHREEHIGAGIGEGAELARQAGFDCVTVFSKRKPVKIRI